MKLLNEIAIKEVELLLLKVNRVLPQEIYLPEVPMTIALPDITVKTQIYESANSLVYRAVRQADNTDIILKVLKQDYPTSAELVRYKQEYEITRALNLEGVIKAYSQQDYQSDYLRRFWGRILTKTKGIERNCLSHALSRISPSGDRHHGNLR